MQDGFMNLAKQGLEAYENSQGGGQQQAQGGAQYNAPHSQQQGGYDGAGGESRRSHRLRVILT